MIFMTNNLNYVPNLNEPWWVLKAFEVNVKFINLNQYMPVFCTIYLYIF